MKFVLRKPPGLAPYIEQGFRIKPKTMTREERRKRRQERRQRIKDSRLEKRNARRLSKELQKRKWTVAKEKIAALPEMEQLEAAPYEEQFAKVWPAVKAVLEFGISLKVTGPKFDQSLTGFIELGDSMASDDEITDERSKELVEKFREVWSWMQTILTVVKVFTGDDADKVIDKIIEVGDWILDEDGAD